MSPFGWILAVFAALHKLPASDADFVSLVVREADRVVLDCPGPVDDPRSCRDAVWTLNESMDPVTISRRRNVTASCQLLIGYVVTEDAGVYSCRSRTRNRTETFLSVVSMVECKSRRFVTVECSVSSDLPHRVEWRGFKGQQGVVTSQSENFASVSFSSAHPVHASAAYHDWSCHVTDNATAQHHVFVYSPKYPVRTTTPPPPPSTTGGDRRLDWLMVTLRLAELGLLIFITVLLFRSRGKKNAPAEQKVLDTSAVRFQQAASQVYVDVGGQEVPINYENV